MPQPVGDIKAKRQARRPAKGETPPKATDDSTQELPPITPKRRSGNDKKLADALTKGYQTIGIAAMGIGARKGDNGIAGTGLAMVESAEAAADAWMELADKNPKVKIALQRITEVTAVGVLAGIHVGIMFPLLVDRGVVPPTIVSMMGDMMTADDAAGNGHGGPSSN